MCNEDFLKERLDELAEKGVLRSLHRFPALTDFTSNDYLGISKNKLLRDFFSGRENHGSTGSRLLAGNYPLMEEAENRIAAFHESEAALIFNSGFDANVGIMSSIPRRGDTIFYDQLCHASIRDGIRLSMAESFSFRHNDVDDLKRKLKVRARNCFVVTESVFSMNGDVAPLGELVSLCERHDLHLIVDEAHALGVIGERGEGLSQHQNLHRHVFARVYTYGKAAGCHGAAIVGSRLLISALVNFARPFIYSTALPETAVRAILASYQLFPYMTSQRDHLNTLINDFVEANLPFEKLESTTPIQGVIVPSNEKVIEAANALQAQGFDVRPIRYPTVPAGSERIRISLHAFNTSSEVKRLAQAICQLSL